MSRTHLNKIIKYIRVNQPSFVCFSGEDIYQENHFVVLLKEAKQVGAKVSVDQLIQVQWSSWAEAILNQVNQIRIFLFPMDLEMQNSTMDIDLSIVKQTVITLRKRYRNTVILVLPVHKGTIKLVYDVVKLAKITDILCNLFPVPRTYNPELALSMDQFWEFAGILNSLRAENSQIIDDMPVAGAIYPNLQGMCPGGRIFFHISVNGKIKICPYCLWDVGSLDENSIPTIVKRWFCDYSLDLTCQSCSHREICGGGCWANRLTLEQPDAYCLYQLPTS